MKTTHSSPAVGGSSLLVIFSVLCLVILALLTLTTAQAEKRLSDSNLSACTTYYEADRHAEEIFARLRAGQMPEGVQRIDDHYHYSIPITAYQSLQVQLQHQDGWQVLRWQTVVTSYPDIDETLPVWNGSYQEVSP